MVYDSWMDEMEEIGREKTAFKQVFFVTSSIIIGIAFVGFLSETDWKRALFLAIFLGFGFGALVSVAVWPAIHHLKEWKRTGHFFR